MEWQLLISVVATAAGVSTAVATGVTLWLRLRERPEPDWVLSGRAQWPAKDRHEGRSTTEITLRAHLANVGDGSAHRVTLKTSRGVAWLGRSGRGGPSGPAWTTLQHVPVMAPGDEVEIHAVCPPEEWAEAAFVLEWTPSPTRRRKRQRQRTMLCDVAELPEPSET